MVTLSSDQVITAPLRKLSSRVAPSQLPGIIGNSEDMLAELRQLQVPTVTTAVPIAQAQK
jgi:hypothetical protein